MYFPSGGCFQESPLAARSRSWCHCSRIARLFWEMLNDTVRMNLDDRKIYHDIPWYTMIYHDIPWYTMIYHDIPWYTMIYHDIPWYTSIFGSEIRYILLLMIVSDCINISRFSICPNRVPLDDDFGQDQEAERCRAWDVVAPRLYIYIYNI